MYDESRNSPFILFMKDAEKSMAGNSDFSTFKSRLEKLPDNVIIIGSHAHTDTRKEKVILFTVVACEENYLTILHVKMLLNYCLSIY